MASLTCALPSRAGLAAHRCSARPARLAVPGLTALCRRAVVVRAQNETKTKSDSNNGVVPPAGKGEELPPWVRREREREMQASNPNKDPIPWPLYLLFSSFTAIAAVGSIFEFVAEVKNPVFGVVPVDSPLWAPILLFFAITGLPTTGFLFYKGVTAFNEAAEQQDRLDGYL